MLSEISNVKTSEDAKLCAARIRDKLDADMELCIRMIRDSIDELDATIDSHRNQFQNIDLTIKQKNVR